MNEPESPERVPESEAVGAVAAGAVDVGVGVGNVAVVPGTVVPGVVGESTGAPPIPIVAGG